MNKVSRLLKFEKTIVAGSTGVGIADDTVRLDQSIQFSNNQSKKTFKVIDGYISSSIPNIFNYGSFNNTVIHVSNDAFATSDVTITLEAGIYTANQIASAINESVSSTFSYTDDADPPLQIYANTVVGKVYIVIDSGKMASGQFAVNFGLSDIATTLGFTTTKLFDTDGTFEADVLAQLDTVGNLLTVKIDGIGYTAITNASSSTDIATVDLTEAVGNVYRISSAFSNVEFDVFPPKEFSNYKLIFVGSRNNRQIVFTEGEVVVYFLLTEYY